MGIRPGHARDLALLFAAKAAIGGAVLALGFTHVSDDDYARVTIAETFAHAPRLDPSGTSWLPLPFWLYGAAMAALGRSLPVARAVACVLGVLATAPPYLALRGVGVGRVPAVMGVALAMSLPWSAWSGVAPIPESMTAGLVAAAAIATARAELAVFGALCALAASLSRYEAWPACAVVALLALVRGRRIGAAFLAALGPSMWMAWNWLTHGDPLHFVARVTAFRQASAGLAAPFAKRLLAYPEALLGTTPALSALVLVGICLLVLPEVRRRWWAPLAVCVAVVAFLVYGEVRDGAPTHHAERALLGVWWIAAAFGVDAGASAARRAGKHVAWGYVAAVCAAAPAVVVAQSVEAWPDYPGRGAEDRTAQIARGLAIRARDPKRLEVVPCAYEHFALLAALGAPERAEIAPSTGEPVTPLCPRVTER